MILALGMFDAILDVMSPANGKEPGYIKSPNVGKRKETSIWKVDYVGPLGYCAPKRAKMIILEDNDAVIATVIKGRSTTLRHCSRTQRIAMDWLLERLREDNSTTLRYVPTRHQSADILTKASFVAPQWGHLCKLIVMYNKFTPDGPKVTTVSVIGVNPTYSYIDYPGSQNNFLTNAQNGAN